MATTTSVEARIEQALALIGEYGEIDGAHHKQWVLDQVARTLAGGDEYPNWVSEWDWEDPGIAP